MTKVILLSPQSDQALAVARYLHKYAKNYVLFGGVLPGEDLYSIPPYYKQIFHVQNKNSLNDYDIVLPTVARSTYWMATEFHRFNLFDLAYTNRNLQYFDKIRILKQVSEIGLPIPRTYETIDEIGSSFPLFYKQKFEEGERVRGVSFSRLDLAKLPAPQDLLFQEYIPGRSTYGMGFIIRDGVMLTSFQHEEVLSQPIHGGAAVLIRRFNSDKLREYTQRITQRLGFDGWGLAEFKYCKKRQDFVFMEINAKLWASIEFAFINNNKFLKYMFGINYAEKATNSALFVDRLTQLGWHELFRNGMRFFDSKIISYQRPSVLLRAFLIQTIRPRILSILKRTIPASFFL